MGGFRRAGIALAVFALAAGQAHSGVAGQARPSPAVLVAVVEADADLASAQPMRLATPVRLATDFKPAYMDKPCSFVPSKNPVKPKKNACRFV